MKCTPFHNKALWKVYVGLTIEQCRRGGIKVGIGKRKDLYVNKEIAYTSAGSPDEEMKFADIFVSKK